MSKNSIFGPNYIEPLPHEYRCEECHDTKRGTRYMPSVSDKRLCFVCFDAIAVPERLDVPELPEMLQGVNENQTLVGREADAVVVVASTADASVPDALPLVLAGEVEGLSTAGKKPKPTYRLTCIYGHTFRSARKHARFCSSACRQRHYRENQAA